MKNKIIVAPCLECDNKGCGEYHSRCKLYKHFVAEKKKENQEMKDSSDKKYYYHRRYF